MKIQENRLNKIAIKDVPLGGVFKYGICFFIKMVDIYDDNGNVWNITNLSDGKISHLGEHATVEYYPDAYLAIE